MTGHQRNEPVRVFPRHWLGEHFAAHQTVDHSKTFVRGVIMHTNFAATYHSLLKRGIIGAFHHVSDKHLDRYLAEFDRRWNSRNVTVGERTVNVIETAIGKRLTFAETVSRHRNAIQRWMIDGRI